MELINPEYYNLLKEEIKINICELAPKFNDGDPEVYLNHKLELLEKTSNSQSLIGFGRLSYKDGNGKINKIDIIAKIYSTGIQYSPLRIGALNYEEKVYEYIKNNILVQKICPNFVGYIGKANCDREKIQKFIIEDTKSTERELDNLLFGDSANIILTQAIKYSLNHIVNHDFPKVKSSLELDELTIPILFQIMYIFLVLEHFKIQHNDSHLGNFRVDVLEKPVKLFYSINNQLFKIETKYVIYLYDWDLSFANILETNINLTNFYHSLMVPNLFIYKRDFSYTCTLLTQTAMKFNYANLHTFIALDIYLARNFNVPLLTLLLQMPLFNRFKVEESTSNNLNELQIFGRNVVFENKFKRFENFHNTLENSIAPNNNKKDNPQNLQMNGLVHVLQNVKSVVLDHCLGYYMQYPIDFQNALSYTFKNYLNKCETDDIINCVRDLHSANTVELLLYKANVNELSRLLYLNQNVKNLVIINNTPFTGNIDNFLEIFPNLEYIAINTNNTSERIQNHLKSYCDNVFNQVYTDADESCVKEAGVPGYCAFVSLLSIHFKEYGDYDKLMIIFKCIILFQNYIDTLKNILVKNRIINNKLILFCLVSIIGYAIDSATLFSPKWLQNDKFDQTHSSSQIRQISNFIFRRIETKTQFSDSPGFDLATVTTPVDAIYLYLFAELALTGLYQEKDLNLAFIGSCEILIDCFKDGVWFPKLEKATYKAIAMICVYKHQLEEENLFVRYTAEELVFLEKYK